MVVKRIDGNELRQAIKREVKGIVEFSYLISHEMKKGGSSE